MMFTITGTEAGDAALRDLMKNPNMTREEVIHGYGLTLGEAASVFDAFESWKSLQED
jgi:hypothetical protein